MTAHCAVYWTHVAEADLAEALDYIANDSVRNAQKIFDKITQTAAGLTTLPERGRIVPELKRQGVTEYRELLIKPWRLMYFIDGSKVHVVSFLDGRRDVNELLLGRFLRS